MTISFAALTTPLSRDEVRASIYQVLETVGVDTTTWKPGNAIRSIITGVSIVVSSMSLLHAKIARSGFVELSEGDWLTLVAHYVYGVDRIEATFAEGVLTLTNTGGGVFDLGVGDLIARAGSATYRNTSAFRLGPLQTLDVAIRAVESGSSSNALAGAINTLETTLLGVTCSNALALVGLDAESDDDLRTRCYEKLGALSPMGPWDAYAFAARSAVRADGTRVGVTRVRQLKDGAGGVTTWVATASGAMTGDVDDPDTDLGAVAAAIARLAVPECVTATTASAAPRELAITYEVWTYDTSGLTDAELLAAIGAKLGPFAATLPIGGHVIGPATGKVFRSSILSAIGSAAPEIFRIDLALPAGDVELASNQVPVLGAVLGTVHQVPAAVAAE